MSASQNWASCIMPLDKGNCVQKIICKRKFLFSFFYALRFSFGISNTVKTVNMCTLQGLLHNWKLRSKQIKEIFFASVNVNKIIIRFATCAVYVFNIHAQLACLNASISRLQQNSETYLYQTDYKPDSSLQDFIMLIPRHWILYDCHVQVKSETNLDYFIRAEVSV